MQGRVENILLLDGRKTGTINHCIFTYLTLNEEIAELLMLDSQRPHLAFLLLSLLGLLKWCQKKRADYCTRKMMLSCTFFLCAPVPTGLLFISFCPCSVQAIKKTLKCTAISINPNFNVTDTAKLYLPQELFHICHGGSFYIELIQGGGQHLSKNIDCK